MKNPLHSLPTTRREFLRLGGKGLGLVAFSRFAPSFLVQSTLARVPSPEKDRPILVLIQLAGGNDGLNTVVPFEDDRYYKLRPNLAIPREDILPLTGGLGFHPSFGLLADLFHSGRLGVIQNVGYPNPNRSHFRSTEIWETAADSAEFLSSGWIGRFLDNACSGTPDADGPHAIHAGNQTPQAFFGEQVHNVFGMTPPGRRGRSTAAPNTGLLENLLEPNGDHEPHGENAGFLRQTLMDALVTERRVQDILRRDRPEAEYPANPFSSSLRNIAALIAAGLPTRVYFASLGGFDTHSNQPATHTRLLETLSTGMVAFQQDLESRRLADQVLTMTFSEFGRRPSENASRGTDHGTAAPLFVMGTSVKGGIHGPPPDLASLNNRDLPHSFDFRQVYATVLNQWFQTDAAAVLSGSFTPVDFIDNPRT